jgi:hypothetical protein
VNIAIIASEKVLKSLSYHLVMKKTSEAQSRYVKKRVRIAIVASEKLFKPLSLHLAMKKARTCL